MADYTSSQAGDWNASATWGGSGTPSVDADTATIGHAVDYNLGNSTIDFGNVTINSGGTLTFPTDANSTINFNATAVFTINDGGTLNIGTSTTPIDASYTCRLYWDQGASERYVFVMNDGSSINIYGDPDFYGDRRTADLDSTWSSGQILYVTGDVTSDWSAGLKFAIHKMTDYSLYTTDCDIYEIATVGTYDSGNDRTPITIDETAPAITYNATHATTGFQNFIIILSRNVELADTGIGWIGGAESSYSNRLRLDNNQFSSNADLNFNNALFYGWRDGFTGGYNGELERCVFVHNEDAAGSYSNNYQIIECDFVLNDNTISFAASLVSDCNFISNDCSFDNCILTQVDDSYFIGNDYVFESQNYTVKFKNCVFASNDDVFRYDASCEALDCTFFSNNYVARDPFNVLLTNCDLSDNTAIFYSNDDDIGILVLADCTIDGADRLPLRIYNAKGTILPLESGDTDWQTPDSGSDWILQAEPTAGCKDRHLEYLDLSPIQDMFDYAPSGSRTLTFKIYPVDWTTTLNQDDVVLELNYLDSASGLTRTTTANSSQTYANGAWRDVTVSFSPTQGGVVYFNLFLKTTEEDCYILIDPVWSLV